MGSGEIVIRNLDVMRELIDKMQETGAQGYDIRNYTTEWVCQKDGFEPSPLCALRPFAAAMDVIEEAISDAFLTFQSRWSALTTGVADAVLDFEKQEGNVEDTMDALLNRPVPVYVNGKPMVL